MTRILATGTNVVSTRGSNLKERKGTHSSLDLLKSHVLDVPTSIKIGSSLPRTVRARLSRTGDRKAHSKASKHHTQVVPAQIDNGGSVWLSEMISDKDLPSVLYSDKRGEVHGSLNSEDSSAVSVDLAGSRKEALGMTTRLQTRMKDARNSRLWTSKRGCNNVKAMHTIQQAFPRTLSHN